MEEKMSLVDTFSLYISIPSPAGSPPRFLSSSMTSKNFVKWLETGQKSKQTMPGWDQNVEEIEGFTQPCAKGELYA